MLRIKDGFKGERALTLPLAAINYMESTPLTSLLHVTHIGYYPRARHHHRQRTETIDQWIFIYCVDGCGSYEVEGNHYEVTPHHYFIIPAHKKHSYKADSKYPWTIYWMHFKGSLASELTEDVEAPQPIYQSTNSRINDRIELFEQIFHTLERGYSPQNLQFSSGALLYFFTTVRFVNEFRAALGTKTGSIIELASHYIVENMSKKISVAELAEVMGYSSSHISFIFKRETGMSPTEYINSIKIRESCRMLDFTSMHVNQIAPKVGVPDSYYFTRLFTKTMGLTPTDYRNQKKG